MCRRYVVEVKEFVRTEENRRKSLFAAPSVSTTHLMTPFILNITFECRDPLSLGQFWAQLTGYTVDPEADETRVRLTHPDDRGVRHLLFLRVETPRVDTRMHVDLAARDPDAEIERLVGAGATLVDQRDSNGMPTWRGTVEKRWVVLRDPEGNEFCLG